MTSASTQPAFPAAALDWLSPPPGGRVLALGRGCAPLAAGLVARGHRVVASDPTRAGLRRLMSRAPEALPTVSLPDRLPFVPTAFDAVFVHQSLHRLDLPAVLREVARVLRPGGHLAVSYTQRDDSVPWVRRLAALVRGIDPDAMSGDYGTDAVARVTGDAFFPHVERRNFRLWLPISRVDMLGMVAARFSDLAEDRRSELMRAVGDLYESSARAPEPLLLPYQVSCWRAFVDHDEFTSQLRLPDDGLQIRL